jgi:hypothetical protein
VRDRERESWFEVSGREYVVETERPGRTYLGAPLPQPAAKFDSGQIQFQMLQGFTITPWHVGLLIVVY